MANEVANKEQNRQLSITAFMTNANVQANIARIVNGKDKDKFVSSIISAVNANPQLSKCTNGSILNAALLGYSLNLSHSPQLGQYYFVPYSNKGTMEAQFQIGYRGLIQLAIRSGYYKKINALAIKEGELIKYDPLNEDIEVNLIDDPIERENAKTIGYYGMFEYTNGFRKCVYWSAAKMEAHRQRYSKSKSVWEANYEAMAIKTVLRNLLSKWGIMSIEMQMGNDADGAIIREGGIYEHVDEIRGEKRVTVEIPDDTPEATPQMVEEAPVSDEKPAVEENTTNGKKAATKAKQSASEAPQEAPEPADPY